MGIQDIQTFLENEGVSVDLFRIARNHPGGFRLVLDAEGCLDRLYGGYFSGNYFHHRRTSLCSELDNHNLYFIL